MGCHGIEFQIKGKYWLFFEFAILVGMFSCKMNIKMLQFKTIKKLRLKPSHEEQQTCARHVQFSERMSLRKNAKKGFNLRNHLLPSLRMGVY